ncbi:MAG: hypothetical protein P8Y44_08540 [Acidobacteriota bacterium]
MNRTVSISSLVLVAVLSLTSSIGSQAQTPPPCNGDLSHQFDFWIGDWQVYSGEDLAGRNSIQPILDGCVLQEKWQGSQGGAGSSFNFYNPQTEKWQQFWVWKNGTTLELEGAFGDGKMVLEGDGLSQAGEPIQHRITWYDNEDGTVRQHWQVSKDGGETFETAFDGLYKKE